MTNFLTNTPIGSLMGGDLAGFLLNLLYLLPALVIGLCFHEAAHAWAALKMGDPTARNMGRLTLDPTKHFTFFGLITFLLIGFGWGKPVPINPRNFNNYKMGNFLVSIAGVATNLLLSFIFFWIYVLLVALDVQSTMILTIVWTIISLNVVLCFFNLIPIPPLDGHHLVKGFIARRSPKFYMTYMQYGYYILLALIFLPRLMPQIPDLIGYYFKYTAGFVMDGYYNLLQIIF